MKLEDFICGCKLTTRFGRGYWILWIFNDELLWPFCGTSVQWFFRFFWFRLNPGALDFDATRLHALYKLPFQWQLFAPEGWLHSLQWISATLIEVLKMTISYPRIIQEAPRLHNKLIVLTAAKIYRTDSFHQSHQALAHLLTLFQINRRKSSINNAL